MPADKRASAPSPPTFRSNSDRLHVQPRRAAEDSPRRPAARGTDPLWNAVDAGIDKLLPEQGRRVVLGFTDGVDRPLDFEKKSKSLKDVMKRAEEKDVMVLPPSGSPGQNTPRA